MRGVEWKCYESCFSKGKCGSVLELIIHFSKCIEIQLAKGHRNTNKYRDKKVSNQF